MIKIRTTDGKITDVAYVVTDIAVAMAAGQDNILLDFCCEGPCLRHIGMYDILDNLCRVFNYDHRRVTIVTANFLEKHAKYQIKHQHQWYELHDTLEHEDQIGSFNKVFDQSFCHFGNFIGHSNRHRLSVASYLNAYHATSTQQTYHTQIGDFYHREHMGLEDIMFHGCTKSEFANAVNLIWSAPLQIDHTQRGPILCPDTLNITKVYPGFFVEIACLTFSSGNVFYVDEKIWRPMLMRTPFIVQGPQFLLSNLKRLGFKTFSNWWDEGYSEDCDETQVRGIYQVIDTIAKLPIHTLKEMYLDMQPVLDHNYNRMKELCDADFNRAFNDQQ